MKRWWWLLVVYVVALVVMLPAKVIYWLPLPPQVSVSQVSGSLWQGNIGALQIQGVPLTNVGWNWRVSKLLTGQLSIDVTVPAAAGNPLTVNGTVQAGLSGVSVDNLRSKGDLATLLQLSNTRLPLTTRGRWSVNVDAFAVSDPGPVKWCNQLRGDAQGQDIQVLVNGVWQNLGDFPVGLSCDNSGAVGLSMNGNNSLGLAFDGTVNSQDIRIAGTVRPNPRTPEGLAKMLQYLGQPDAQGRYRFSL